MILFCSMDDALEKLKEPFDEKYCITISSNKGLLYGFSQRPDLAPSSELYYKTFYSWKKLKFTEEELGEMSEGKTHTWFDLYEKRFLQEMKTRKDMRKALSELEDSLRKGKNIICYCYCSDCNKCHRKLLYQYFNELGYQAELM